MSARTTLRPDDPRVVAVAAAIVGLLDAVAPTPALAGPTHYTTNKSGCQPPGMSRRSFRERAHGIPGARKVGRDWTVPVADFERWAGVQTARRGPKPAPLAGPWSPDGALAEARVRPLGGAR